MKGLEDKFELKDELNSQNVSYEFNKTRVDITELN